MERPPPHPPDKRRYWYTLKIGLKSASDNPPTIRITSLDCCTDKRATEELARDAESKVARKKAGFSDGRDEAYRDAVTKPLSVHFKEWKESLQANGSTPKHVELFSNRAARVVALIRGAKLSDIEPARNAKRPAIATAAATLDEYVASARLSDFTTDAVQKALATLKVAGRSLATCNHHRAAVKAFTKWCHDTHRLRDDPGEVRCQRLQCQGRSAP